MPTEGRTSSRSRRPRARGARAWLLGIACELACAGRGSDAEPPTPAEEKTTHAWVRGDEPAAQAVCERLGEAEDRRACEVITNGRGFDAEVLRLCEDSAAGVPAHGLGCLRAVAEHHFTARSVAACEHFEGGDRNECLEVLAERRLSETQVQECLAEERARGRLRCLRRAHDYALDLEMLYQAARTTAAQPPRLEPLPEADDGGPIPDETLVQARERVRLHNHAELEAMMVRMRAEVEQSFPSLTLASVDHDMVFNFAGAVAAHYRMLYCSRREYLILFGTPIGAHGFSGRYEVDVHDWTLTGRMLIHRVGDYSPTVLDPGSWAKLMADDAKIYRAEPETYMLEYAQGRISSAFDFGITAPARNVSRDFYNMRKQIRSCLDGALERDVGQVRRMHRIEVDGRRVRREIDRDLRAERLAGRLR